MQLKEAVIICLPSKDYSSKYRDGKNKVEQKHCIFTAYVSFSLEPSLFFLGGGGGGERWGKREPGIHCLRMRQFFNYIINKRACNDKF